LKAKSAPILVGLKTNGKYCNFLIAADNKLIDLKSDSLVDGIFDLIIYHYVFRLSYAVMYQQFLGFFQLFCLKNDAKFFKSLSFKKFEQQLKQFLDLS
jgi:hypothetical protein